MEIALAILSFILILVGTAGAVLPLPGPPLSFLGLLILNYTSYATLSQELLWTLGIATLAIFLLDYYIPIWGTKKFGGTKAGTIGSSIGMIIGLFFGPFGLFIGAFAGAFISETIWGNKHNAFKAALGSFVGFAAGIAMKLTLCFIMLYYAITSMI